MRAVTLQHGDLALETLDAPEPAEGQLLLQVERCGICGSDLHARRSGDGMAEVLELAGYPRYMRSQQKVVLGHEFVGTVLDRGPGPKPRDAVKPGTRVVAVPLVRRGKQVDGVGLSVAAPGAYAEQLVVQEALTLAVPNGLSADVAALTEPLAVGWHAVNRGDVRRKDTAVVIGCGPIGLAVIAVLHARGVERIIASDRSPARRALAGRFGARVVVDPEVESPFDHTVGRGMFQSMTSEYSAGIDAVEGLRKLPVPWWLAWRALDRTGTTTPKGPVVFECVGVPGMIDGILADAPLHARVVVVGVCMVPDTLRPALGINKEIDLRFVVGYTPLEFRDTLHALADGEIDASPLVTGHVGLQGVQTAFEGLRDPERHAKVLIDPSISGEKVLP